MLRPTLAVTLFAGCLLAQPATFEVAAIKPAPLQPIGRTSVRTSTNTDTGSLVFSNVNLKGMITRAFRVQQYQVNGPDWIESERFDVTASFTPHSTSEQVAEMLQALLADRFQLKIHRETAELPAFSLTALKSGPKFKPVESEGGVSRTSNGGLWHLTAKVTMRRLAEILTDPAGRPVLDQTGLAGPYDVALDWSVSDAVNADAPSLFTALQEQLGLKLEATKAPVESIIVDSVEKVPSEN